MKKYLFMIIALASFAGSVKAMDEEATVYADKNQKFINDCASAGFYYFNDVVSFWRTSINAIEERQEKGVVLSSSASNGLVQIKAFIKKFENCSKDKVLLSYDAGNISQFLDNILCELEIDGGEELYKIRTIDASRVSGGFDDLIEDHDLVKTLQSSNGKPKLQQSLYNRYPYVIYGGGIIVVVTAVGTASYFIWKKIKAKREKEKKLCL